MKFSAIIDGEKRVFAKVKREGDRLTVTFPKEELKDGKKDIFLFKDELTSPQGADGWLFDTLDFENYSSALTFFREDREDFSVERRSRLINAFGGNIGGICFLGIITGMPYEFTHIIGKENGRYYLTIKYNLEASEIYEDIVIEMFLHSPDATYIDLAKTYRNYLLTEGGCTPLVKRAEGNESLSYLRDSVEIRMRLGWKPAPCTVKVQTVENEPEMHVACTFSRVRDFADELKKAGVEKAEICLVGWNKSGHDGRWPEAFPVEERLGGEEELRKTIEHVKSLGYKIVCHSNSIDCYRISGVDFDKACKKERDGSIKVISSDWSGGENRWACPYTSLETTRALMPKLRELGFEGAHYIDVFSIVMPYKCFDKSHPATERDFVRLWGEGIKCVREHFGAFQSEGAFDHTASMLDFGLYVKFYRRRNVHVDKGIPFFEIATHGIFMANQGTNTVNSPIKERKDLLQQIEFGGKPAFYIHSQFCNNGNNWMGNVDYITDTDADLERAAKDVRAIEEIYAPLSHLQNEFIEDYVELTPEVRKTVYSNGEYTVVNYSDTPYTLDNGTVVEPKGYVLCH